nr:reverse transcriptase domain-containing protein [Tanacetum cinerariifolium]
EGDDKFPVIIAKDLSMEEKTALITVLKSHKRAIAWKLSDIKGTDPEFCTHKILMEEDFESAVQHQRRVNPKIHDVIKQEVIKLLDVGLIYPISDSPWVSPVHCVPKKGGFTVVENEDNELILTRLVTDAPFIFSKECVEAFQTLKRKLTEAPILIAPDWDMPFELMCDASDFAIGAVLRAIINDRGIHFCNYQFAKVMQKFSVTHRLATPYHPQTSGQVKVSNRGLKRIIERAVGNGYNKKGTKSKQNQIKPSTKQKAWKSQQKVKPDKIEAKRNQKVKEIKEEGMKLPFHKAVYKEGVKSDKG